MNSNENRNTINTIGTISMNSRKPPSRCASGRINNIPKRGPAP